MPETPDPDNTPATALFDEIAAAVNKVPLTEAEEVLSYMTAVVAVKRRQGLPAAGIKAEMADLLGRAVDSLTSEPDSP
jgi:hypothetical protein